LNRPVSKVNAAEPPRSLKTAEDSFLDLLIETLGSLDRPVRGQFLQKFFKSLAQVDLTEGHSLECWDQILTRRRELSESLSRPISLKTVIVDVLASTNYLRMPILMEYEELKKLQINAATDALTGLYNRRLFEEYLNKELNRAKRYGQHLAVVILDLHQFKEVNDRYGHAAGDQALQQAATTLRKTLRTSDYAFRIGGDEFALLLPQSDPEQAATLCRRLRANYDSAILPLKFDVPLAADYGLAVFPEDGDQREALLRVADERLYELKHTSRTAPRVVPLEPAAQRPLAGKPAASAPVPRSEPVRPTSETRKWERVSLVGTRAYAVLGSDQEKTARVIDLSYGGVALLMDASSTIPQNFQAVLHVPILPPVKVSLRKVYEQPQDQSYQRVGCAFVS
jgi:diguanylate cyclase (GGDEF)-like protein